MFVDRARITIISGKGGNGAVTFRREPYVPEGGPDGGDGGKGGDVIFVADRNLRTLMDFRYKRKYQAENGADGMKRKKYGKSGSDLIIKVPMGTVIIDEETGLIMKDLTEDGESFVAARGGRGGRGNVHFKNSVRQAPNFAEAGGEAKERRVILEMKLIADVGLVGYPNVGKSTLLSVMSSARPKIANYHFTTLSPNLGVVKYYDHSFIAADIPGLIDGASKGAGLGTDFLRHIERTRLIVHVVDISGSEGRNPVDDYRKINDELKDYSPKLALLPQIAALNKADMAEPEQLRRFKEAFPDVPCVEISAIIGQNVDALIKIIYDELQKLPPVAPLEYTPFEYDDKSTTDFYIMRDDDGAYEICGGLMDELARNVVIDNNDSFRYFQKQLKDRGVIKALRKAGAKDGDLIRIMDIEFDFVE